MMNEQEFNLLYNVSSNNVQRTQRIIAEELGLSLGKTNNLIALLKEKKLLNANDSVYEITELGRQALDEHKVDNAIIMAAGMSSRFAPLSYEKPKGLLKVKGEILIEREIRQLQAAGISDITIVVGYMKEKFFYLEEKFGVKIVVNDDYYRYNNTSTLIRVLDKLSNTYICSSDNYFVENVFESHVYQSYYSAVYAPGKTDEYCLEYSSKGKIKNVTIGGANSWYMLGHVYFDKNFSEKFKSILQREYENKETRDHLWENLYMRYIDQLDLYIRKYDSEKIFEFDSLDELRLFDSEYINNADSSILKNICFALKCETKDIVDIKAIKEGLTNTSFKFRVGLDSYVYRHPGKGTEKYINRKSEAYSMKIASSLGLDDTFVMMDEKSGWKISRFIKDVRQLDYHNHVQVSEAIKLMKRLHDSRIEADYDFNIWNKTLDFVNLVNDMDLGEDYDNLFKKMESIRSIVSNDGYAVKCLCHNDCYSPNFLIDNNDKMYLIDWEYSGNDDPASDLGTFICCSDYSLDEAIQIIEQYLGYKPESDELCHYLGYIAMASYYWYVWALYQEKRGNPVDEWLYLWYKNSKVYANKVFEMKG